MNKNVEKERQKIGSNKGKFRCRRRKRIPLEAGATGSADDPPGATRGEAEGTVKQVVLRENRERKKNTG